jgi:hypothetical protein
MSKPQETSLPVNNSSCQTGQAHQTSHCKKLEDVTLLLFDAVGILSELSSCDYVKHDSVWNTKMDEIRGQICCNAKDLAEFYGMTSLCEKHQKKGGNNG